MKPECTTRYCPRDPRDATTGAARNAAEAAEAAWEAAWAAGWADERKWQHDLLRKLIKEV